MNILIADDDPVSRMILQRTLQSWGYTVKAASDGLTALNALQQPDAPKLAVIDWMMPGMDGPEICKAIRANGDEPYRYLLLLTARTEMDDLVEGLEAGADDFLSKPFNPHELRARLRAGVRILQLQSELICAREALRKQATSDALTGVFNRATIMEKLDVELERSGRTGAGLGLLLIDLDHFKAVNDTYGHLAGDDVLREACARIQNSLRSYDHLGRYGGEEFLVVLPNSDASTVLKVAERLRAALEASPILADGSLIKVTASMGAALTNSYLTPSTLIGAADIALYRAKENGRNQVQSAWENEQIKAA